jgi:hypothetical protein
VEKPIESVQIVSDGILVRFADGVLTYFPQGFLRDHIGVGSNQIFVDYEQSFDHRSSQAKGLRLQ